MLAFLLLTALAVAQPEPDTVVVCPAPFRQAIEPWLAYRAGEGHRAVVISSAGTAEEIRGRIRAAAKAARVRFLVLVGDADPALRSDPAVRGRCIPAPWAHAEVVADWGSEPHIGTDNWYADLDDDRMPDLAVGRLTADTPEELATMVRKTLAYERSGDFGAWRRRMNVVAGAGRLNPVWDAVIENTARYFLAQAIPAAYDVSVTQGRWESPYCPAPEHFRAATLERLNEGCLFWVYVGHGYLRGLDRVEAPGADYPMLDTADASRLACAHGAPIALLLSCYAGAFDATEDCLAEAMLSASGGPVAAVAASRMTMPYATAVIGQELMDQFLHGDGRTLGEALLAAKRNMIAEPKRPSAHRAMLDTLAAAFSPAPSKMAAERAEHVLLFNLLGDPLLRLPRGRPVEMDLPSTVAEDESLVVEGRTAVEGRATVELVVSRERLAFVPLPRDEYPRSPEQRAQFDEVYRKANDGRLAWDEAQVTGGRFRVRLQVPASVAGACQVRVFVEGKDDFALGSQEITITPGRETPSLAGRGSEPAR